MARPTVEPASPVDACGAYCNVYVVASAPEEALGTARREVAEAGWDWVGFEQMHVVTRYDLESVDADADALRYFEQVVVDGVVVVIHTFSAEDPEDDTARPH